MTVYVTTADAAAYLNMPETTIRWWAHIGKATRYGTPQRALYDLEELIDLLDKPSNANLSSVGVLHPQDAGTSPEAQQAEGHTHERGNS